MELLSLEPTIYEAKQFIFNILNGQLNCNIPFTNQFNISNKTSRRARILSFLTFRWLYVVKKYKHNERFIEIKVFKLFF